MNKAFIASIYLFLLVALPPLLPAQTLTGVAVFSEPGFPSADSAEPSSAQVSAMLPETTLAWVVNHAADFKFDVNRLVVMGTSAAGHRGADHGHTPCLYPTPSRYVCTRL